MKTKIIISLFLLISAHNSFCMLNNPNQIKHVQKICTAQQTNQKIYQKPADTYLKPFMLRSLLDNAERFDKQNPAVKRAIIRQCKENHDTSPIIGLIQLPIEDQIKIISYFFENKCKKAAEYFLSMPLETALIKYNALPENTLTLLQPKAKLSQSIIFRLTKEEEKMLAAIYTDQTMATKKLKTLLKLLPHDILQIILEQNLNVITPEHENKLNALLTTLHWRLTSRNTYPIFSLALVGVTPLLPVPIIISETIFNPKGTDFHALAQAVPMAVFLFIPLAITLDCYQKYNSEIEKVITKPLKSLL